MTDDPVIGGLFRRNFIREPVLLADSARTRQRLYRWFESGGLRHSDFADEVESELGIEYPVGYESYLHQQFWATADITDILSAITIYLKLVPRVHLLEGARRILAEEQMRYRIDDKGGVHFFVDEELERTLQAAIAGLGEPRFTAALHALEQGIGALGVGQQSGKTLIRGVFEAVESAFLTVIAQPKVDRIGNDPIDRYLKPILLDRYQGWADAPEITERTLAVLKAWIKIGHYYRHGSPLEQIHEPPLDLAIGVASEGMSILRYLVGK